MTALPARHRDVNTVFQEYALFPHMTVAQNVEYGLKVKGVPKAERRRRTADALDMVRLTDLAPRRPAQLSGDSVNASRWRGHWSDGRGCCCSTSRLARWISSCVSRCR